MSNVPMVGRFQGDGESNKGFETCFEACFQPQTAFDVGRGQSIAVIQVTVKGKQGYSGDTLQKLFAEEVFLPTQMLAKLNRRSSA